MAALPSSAVGAARTGADWGLEGGAAEEAGSIWYCRAAMGWWRRDAQEEELGLLCFGPNLPIRSARKTQIFVSPNFVSFGGSIPSSGRWHWLSRLCSESHAFASHLNCAYIGQNNQISSMQKRSNVEIRATRADPF
jgi:hypothetical protein